MDDTEKPNSGAPHEWPFELFDPSTFLLPQRRVTTIVLDNTGWDSSAFSGVRLVEEVNRWHRAEGWKGITHHFVVDKQGNIVKGRSLEEAAIIRKDKLNGEVISIAVQGLWHFTEIQLRSVRVLCTCIDNVATIFNKPVTFHGMCEFISVPSPMFDYTALLGLDAAGRFNEGPSSLPDLVAQEATRFEPLGAVA